MLMDFSFFLTTVAAAAIVLFLATVVAITIGFFTLFRKFIIQQESKDAGSSATSALSSSYGTHHVFLSFRGEDVRKTFLSHIQKELRIKGITPFIDHEIRRGEFIGPELFKAIRASKIAIVVLSRNYASSKWCIKELVEIMNRKKIFGLTVFVIFYEVDPSHVKKLTGDFGAVFKKTCKGRTNEETKRWRRAFKKVAKIAGYDSRGWPNEAVMIEEIVTEISIRLISDTPSSDVESLIGMGAHMDNIKQLLYLDSTDETRIIGIWGPSGIGKTTIARVLHNQLSHRFELSVFMKFKPTSPDDYDVGLQLQQQFLSQLPNQEEIKILHQRTAQTSFRNKKVLLVLDDVDHLSQLDILAGNTEWFGPGSRIIITTEEDQKILKASVIKNIYKVHFPEDNEALQIFCMNAFGQNSPYDGFENLAWEVTQLAGRLPLGLRVMGSHLRGMSKQEWKAELPRLRVCLDGEIWNTLKFCYDALDDEDQDLFLYIACFFNDEVFDHTFEDSLRHKFSNVQQRLQVLVQRSLISEDKFFLMHKLLVQLGRQIVRNQSTDEPGKRQFLVDATEIGETLVDCTGTKSVIGINWNNSLISDGTILSERAFEKMSDLQLLRIDNRVDLPEGLNYLSPNLRILHWNYFSMSCLPSEFDPKFLVKIILKHSMLEKLWQGNQPLFNLKVMNLSFSRKLKELPDLSTASNLLEINLLECSSLIKLPSSIVNIFNLEILNLRGCSSLLKLPSSIGNIINGETLNLSGCSSLVKLPSSIGDTIDLKILNLNGCSSLLKLPSSIGDIFNLEILNLRRCSNLVELPSSIGNITNLQELDLTGCSSLVKIPSSIENIINLEIFGSPLQ